MFRERKCMEALHCLLMFSSSHSNLTQAMPMSSVIRIPIKEAETRGLSVQRESLLGLTVNTFMYFQRRIKKENVANKNLQ